MTFMTLFVSLAVDNCKQMICDTKSSRLTFLPTENKK